MPEELKSNDDQVAGSTPPIEPEQSLTEIENGVSDVEVTPTVSADVVSDETRPWLKEEEKKPPKKGKLIGIIVAIFAIVLLGSGYAGYALWYQNPEKVVTDSILGVVLAKSSKTAGDITIKYNDFVFALDFTGESGVTEGSSGSTTLTIKNKDQNIDIGLRGQGVVAANGDIYFKVNDLKKVYNDALDTIIDSQIDTIKQQGQALTDDQIAQMRQAYDSLVGPTITKIGDKWVKVSTADMKSFDEKISKEYTCVQEVFKKVKDDKKLIDQVSDVYMKHRFLVIDESLGVKDGSVGYVVGIDKEIGKKFDKAIEDTTLYKELADCSSGSTQYLKSQGETESKDDEGATHKIEVWANQWSHQLTNLKTAISSGKGDDKMTVDLNVSPQINVPVTVTTPTNVISLKDIMEAFTTVMGAESEGVLSRPDQV